MSCYCGYFFLWHCQFSYSYTYNVIFREKLIGWRKEEKTASFPRTKSASGSQIGHNHPNYYLQNNFFLGVVKSSWPLSLETHINSKIWYFWLLWRNFLIQQSEFNCIICIKRFLLERRSTGTKKYFVKLTKLQVTPTSTTKTNTNAIENETLESQTKRLVKIFGGPTISENNIGQNEVIEKNNADKTTRDVDNAAMAVENQLYDAILAAMDSVLLPRV